MKIIQGALFATAAGALTFGAAASLNVGADDLGSGSAPVQSCDTDGVRVMWNTETPVDDRLNMATLDGLDTRCIGQEARVQVFDADGNMIGWGVDTIFLAAGVTQALIGINANGPFAPYNPPAIADVASTTLTITGAATSTG